MLREVLVRVMRSFKLLVVAVLAVLLVASSASFASAQPNIGKVTIVKVTTNGDTTTSFEFYINSPHATMPLELVGGGGHTWGNIYADDWTVREEDIPSGWVLEAIDCRNIEGYPPSTWEIDLGNAQVIIDLAEPVDTVGAWVECTFTNSGPTPSVELCVIQWGVEEQNGTVSWWPGYAYPDLPPSQCQNKSEYYTDVLGRTIVIHQFNQTRIS